MGALQDRLRVDLTASMKARDELRTATLRMTLTALGNEQVAGKAARALSDEQELAVLAREAKKRREAAEAFRAGGAAERADRELAEEQVLALYLPPPLTDEELEALVAQTIAETGASGPQAMGTVMKTVGPIVAGRAEGGRVAAAVRAALAG
ncbi:MAG: GatB/YqeY domain-containing protein [Actinobacteria bacterium]|nr:GatB/YqeY domain-containing protein [Actinomycetota bacterium]MBW3646184.1 GatB/YqeY domain-containing protein [Actinomycetota bacterium]